MAKPSTRFVCQGCGYASSKWLGRCPECAEWNSLVEETTSSGKPAGAVSSTDKPRPIADVEIDHAPRMQTGIGELDRVLGGGLVAGSLVLLGGDPGIGKSTLLLQALDGLARAGKSVLYVSGEESVQQTALRASRLGVRTPSLHVLAETQLERILDQATAMKPAVLAVDSVQTMHASSLESIPGSLGQVREAAGRLLTYAKTKGVPVVLVGHVTKDGALAGPKTLEHVVDCVLYFEGERTHNYRILRTTKNRFGSTNEIGVFEMRAEGLGEVQNPSALFLAERPLGAPGSMVVASVEGSRPILVEIQALVAHAAGVPRRTALGIDPNRVSLLLAVIERRAGIDVLGQDVFVNVAGGVRVTEPASDLGVLAAVASSARSKAIDPHTLCFGEVGLAGEVRAVGAVEPRLAEARKLGFRRCVLPELSRTQVHGRPELELVGVRDVGAALEALLG
ncbi:MAG TPA: DNA repair protein RadA [Polyangia bacterium]|nr:DNA repair protein RadA [Polyangia bacterium]